MVDNDEQRQARRVTLNLERSSSVAPDLTSSVFRVSAIRKMSSMSTCCERVVVERC